MATNLVTRNQASVETDTTGIGQAQTVTLSRDTTTAWDGASSLKVVTPGSVAGEGFTVPINAEVYTPSGTYTASVYLKGSGTVKVRFSQIGVSDLAVSGVITLTGTWTRYSITATLPGSLSGQYGLVVSTDVAQALTFNADAIQIEGGASASAWAMPPSNALSANQASVETDTTGWTAVNTGSTLTRVTTEHWAGAAAMQVVTDGTIQPQGAEVLLPANNFTPGETVTISCYVKGTAGTSLRLFFHQQSPSTVIGTSQPFTCTGSWQRVTVQVTLPSTLLNTNYGLRVDDNSLSALTWYMDGLQIVHAPSAPAWDLPPNAVSGASALSGGANATLAATVLKGIRPNGLQVLMAGQDITNHVVESSIDIQLILAQGAGVGGGGAADSNLVTFDTYLGPAASAIGAGATPSGTDLVRLGEVKLYDATGAQIFGGFVTKLDDKTDGINVLTTVSCDDYWGALDRIQVFELYTGMGDVAIIKDLLTKYAPWVTQTLLPATDNYIYDKLAAKGTLREMIQKLADNVGWGVWVDAAKLIHYVSLTNASTAPFAVSDDPDYLTTFSHAITAYEQDDTAVVNRVYFYGGKNVSDDFVQDLSIQSNGVNKTFALLYFPHAASDGLIHLKKNGVDLVLYSVFDTNPTHALKSDPNGVGTADALINKDSEVIIFDTAPLATDTLTCTYRYNTPLVIVLESLNSHNFFGAWYDARITDTQVYDTNTALQRCRSLLAEQDFGLETVTFVTWTAGLQPGQLVAVTNSVRGIDKTYLIQKVHITPLGGGFFQYEVQAGAWNWSLMDVLMQAARILNPTDSATEEDMTIIQAKEQAEAALVVVAITKTETTSGVYYSRTTPSGDGHDAYSGFFSITS